MFFVRALLILILAPFICAIIGFALGTAIGTAMPEYYHTVFHRPIRDPVMVGQGLGVTQGFGVGVFIALFLLALLTWHSRRTLRMEEVEALNDRLDRIEKAITDLQKRAEIPAKME